MINEIAKKISKKYGLPSVVLNENTDKEKIVLFFDIVNNEIKKVCPLGSYNEKKLIKELEKIYVKGFDESKFVEE